MACFARQAVCFCYNSVFVSADFIPHVVFNHTDE